jgi:hypothetical protein
MQTDLWTIDDGTGEKTAEELGLTGFGLKLINQANDLMTFSVADADLDAENLWEYGDSLSLYKDGVKWFSGKVITSPRFGNTSAEGVDYEVAGPWHDLRLNFEQNYYNSDDVLDVKTHVVLGKDIDGDEVDIGTVLAEVLDFGISKGANLTYVQTELDELTVIAPYDDQTDISCSKAIRTMLAWVPDMETWFDYSGTTPVLHFTRRADADAVQYDYTTGEVAESLQIKSRNDIQFDGAMINWETQDGSSSWYGVDRDIYPEGTTSGLTTYQVTIVINDYDTLTEAPEGLAEFIYDAVSVLHYEGSLSLIEEECSAGPRPGKVLNLANGLAAWASMRAVIQSVYFDIDAGRTTITFGPPEHLGPTDYVTLLEGNTTRATSTANNSNETETTLTAYHVKQISSDGKSEVWDEVHMT